MRAENKCSLKNLIRMQSQLRTKWDKMRNIVNLLSNLNENALNLYFHRTSNPTSDKKVRLLNRLICTKFSNYPELVSRGFKNEGREVKKASNVAVQDYNKPRKLSYLSFHKKHIAQPAGGCRIYRLLLYRDVRFPPQRVSWI